MEPRPQSSQHNLMGVAAQRCWETARHWNATCYRGSKQPYLSRIPNLANRLPHLEDDSRAATIPA